MPFDLGDPIPLAVSITDSTGAAANAGAVTLTVTLPDYTTATPAVSNPTTGSYTASYVPTTVGHYAYRWVATGANASAYADVFDVVDETAAITSLSEIKTHLNITSTTYDEELRRFRDVAEALAESYTGTRFRRTLIVGEQVSGGGTAILLRNRPVQSITAVSENGYALTAGYYSLNRAAGILTRTSGYPYYAGAFLPGYLNVSIDYVAGYGNNAPADVKAAVTEIVRILWNDSQRGGGRGVAPGGGGEDSWSPSANTLPPAVTAILSNYIALGVA